MENSVLSYFFFFLLDFAMLFFSGCLTGNRDILFLPSIDKNGFINKVELGNRIKLIDTARLMVKK